MEDHPFRAEGRSFPGWLMKPSTSNGRGVLLLHGGRGRGDHERERGGRLVELGFAVYAPDLFGEVFADRAHGMAVIEGLMADSDRLRARLVAAHAVLAGEVARTVAAGHCFGGLAALELARSGAELRAAVALHGHLKTSKPAAPGAIRGKVLACIGAADPFCPPEQRAAFEAEMTAAGADWQTLTFGGALHGFSVPAANAPGLAHHPTSDARSWAAMLALFDEAG
jgi:dienelactone hydrolase